MSTASLEIVNEGWLTKSPPCKRLWRAKWRRRWFVLRHSGELPGQFVLEYFADRSCTKPKGHIDLDQCEQVDAGLTFKQGRHQFQHLFDLRTPKRVYYLAAESETDMTKWVDCICQVCGLKAYTREDEYYDFMASPEGEPGTAIELSQVLPPAVSLAPAVPPRPVTPVSEVVEIPAVAPREPLPEPSTSSAVQERRSPSPSLPNSPSISGPYIPISECITGKPLHPFQLGPVPYPSQSYDVPRLLQPNAQGQSETPSPVPSTSNLRKSPLPPTSKMSSEKPPSVNWTTYPKEEEALQPTLSVPPVTTSASTTPLVTPTPSVTSTISNTSAPPRPPKPPHLRTDEDGSLQIHQSSQSSSPSASPSPSPRYITDQRYEIPRLHQDPTAPPQNRRHCYSNAAPGTVNPNNDHLFFRYDFDMPHTFTATSSASASPSPSPRTPPATYANMVQVDMPPSVDRQLKPGKRKTSEGTSSPSPSWTNTPRSWSQTLPTNWNKTNGGKDGVMPPDVDRTLKPHRQNPGHSPNPSINGNSSGTWKTSTPRSAPCPPLSSTGTWSGHKTKHFQRALHRDPSSSEEDLHRGRLGTWTSMDEQMQRVGRHITDIQYLDLDLEKEVGNHSINGSCIAASVVPSGGTGPRSPDSGSIGGSAGGGIVYKTVDFVKTEAFKRTREKVLEERNKDVDTQ